MCSHNTDDLNLLFSLIHKVIYQIYCITCSSWSSPMQKALEHALECLTREDPSLRCEHNGDTGQTILSGMGELHLEIIADRILKVASIHPLICILVCICVSLCVYSCEYVFECVSEWVYQCVNVCVGICASGCLCMLWVGVHVYWCAYASVYLYIYI